MFHFGGAGLLINHCWFFSSTDQNQMLIQIIKQPHTVFKDSQTLLWNFLSQASIVCTILNILNFQAPTEQFTELWTLKGLSNLKSNPPQSFQKHMMRSVTTTPYNLAPIS